MNKKSSNPQHLIYQTKKQAISSKNKTINKQNPSKFAEVLKMCCEVLFAKL